MAVPATIPVTIPDVEPIEATVILSIDQIPPVVVLFKVVDAPSQALAVPVIATGVVFTLTDFEAIQPLIV